MSERMSPVAEAYNQWAAIYDTNENRTRDLEAALLRRVTGHLRPATVLELGCGTGKNTGYLASIAGRVLALDFSGEMIARAREKHRTLTNVAFGVQDLMKEKWSAEKDAYQLAVFSLVLEHLPDLVAPLRKAAACLQTGGYLYVSELHPYRQYAGGQARFTNDAGAEQLVPAHLHAVQDYWDAGRAAGLSLAGLWESKADDESPSAPPRLLTLLFRK